MCMYNIIVVLLNERYRKQNSHILPVSEGMAKPTSDICNW